MQEFRDKEAFEKAACQWVSTHLQTALSEKGGASLLLSGGSTPGPIYSRLSRMDLDWPNILVGQVDERWVSAQDKASNARLIHETLLQNRAASAEFLPMKTEHVSAQQAENQLNQQYMSLFARPAIAILGMGPDGHTASWFPGQGLGAALNPQEDALTLAITAKRSTVTGDNLERMTLTLSAILRCTKLLLLTKGDDKREILKQAAEKARDLLPVSHLLHYAQDKLTLMHLEG